MDLVPGGARRNLTAKPAAGLLAAVKASQGQPYRYPLTLRLVR